MDKLLVSCVETENEIQNTIEGNIPSWISVRMIRLGPAKWDLDDFVLNHWLDGCAMLCKFIIRNGTIKYSSKFLDSDAYRKMNKVNRPVYTEFGTRAFPDPCKNVFSRIFSQIVPSDLTDNGLLNVFKLADEYYAASETCNIWKFCPKSLDVTRKINLDKINGVNLACSHTQFMENEDYAYNMSSSFLTGMKYHLIKIPLFQYEETRNKSFLERSSILTTISSNWTTCIAYYHSFGITKNYIIFIELPLLVNGFKLATCTPKGRPLKDCFEWHPNEKSKFYVICKFTGKIVQKYYSAAFFYFHIINCYEEDNHIIVDLMAYENADILEKWDLNLMRQNIYYEDNQSVPKRFILPLSIKNSSIGENLVTLKNQKSRAILSEKNIITLTGEELGRPGFELPTINRNYNGKKYKYCYGSGVFEKGNFANSILKLNVDDQSVLVWKDSDEHFPGECLFVARPGSIEEDDGVILNVVLSSNESKPHYVLILDSKTFTEIGRAYLGSGTGIIPPTIHGVFEYINDEDENDKNDDEKNVDY
ncbi:Beta, beta-carotene 15, 15'-dioxygenase [Sarcoptes scabiei]|uniref:Beta,beta-carotene 15,15'-dioxygenase n=1 Tax=Sarcoptes scabiei TaxID=52283 RepID=A0A834VE99_SARSC|nr:Beta, beta-carotene 15, 15'-dioxygenase [Sarcoptes scabiei]